jgi:hypothetical protein
LTGLVDGRYESLKEKLDQAGIPWTPGRGIQPVSHSSANN